MTTCATYVSASVHAFFHSATRLYTRLYANVRVVGLTLLADPGGVRAPAEYADEFGVSCVHLAAKRGDFAMIQALVSFGADWQVFTRCTAPFLVRFVAREYILYHTAWFL